MLKIYKVLLPVVVCIAYGNTSDNMAPVDWHNTHMLESCCNNSQLHNTVSKQVMSKNNNLLNQYNNDNQYTEQIWNNNVNTLINPIPVKKKLLNNNLTNNHQNLGIINNNESCMMLIYNCIKKM